MNGFIVIIKETLYAPKTTNRLLQCLDTEKARHRKTTALLHARNLLEILVIWVVTLRKVLVLSEYQSDLWSFENNEHAPLNMQTDR